jgi:hypothetical protein
MRPSHPPAASALLAVFLAGAAAAMALAIGACADPDTQTPTCVPNVDQTGVHVVANGCEAFPTCTVGNGAASNCCVQDGGAPLTGNDLATCLYGYGDPQCAYLVSTTDGANVSYTCSATAPTGAGDGG